MGGMLGPGIGTDAQQWYQCIPSYYCCCQTAPAGDTCQKKKEHVRLCAVIGFHRHRRQLISQKHRLHQSSGRVGRVGSERPGGGWSGKWTEIKEENKKEQNKEPSGPSSSAAEQHAGLRGSAATGQRPPLCAEGGEFLVRIAFLNFSFFLLVTRENVNTGRRAGGSILDVGGGGAARGPKRQVASEIK